MFKCFFLLNIRPLLTEERIIGLILGDRYGKGIDWYGLDQLEVSERISVLERMQRQGGENQFR